MTCHFGALRTTAPELYFLLAEISNQIVHNGNNYLPRPCCEVHGHRAARTNLNLWVFQTRHYEKRTNNCINMNWKRKLVKTAAAHIIIIYIAVWERNLWPAIQKSYIQHVNKEKCQCVCITIYDFSSPCFNKETHKARNGFMNPNVCLLRVKESVRPLSSWNHRRLLHKAHSLREIWTILVFAQGADSAWVMQHTDVYSVTYVAYFMK